MQTNPTVFDNVINSTRSIFVNEGISAFWKGAVPTAAGMAAENVMAFGVNEALKRAFPEPKKLNNSTTINEAPSLVRPFIMGAITGCCSALVLLPSEIIKCKLQRVQGTNDTTQHIIKEMIKNKVIQVFL